MGAVLSSTLNLFLVQIAFVRGIGCSSLEKEKLLFAIVKILWYFTKNGRHFKPHY